MLGGAGGCAVVLSSCRTNGGGQGLGDRKQDKVVGDEAGRGTQGQPTKGAMQSANETGLWMGGNGESAKDFI